MKNLIFKTFVAVSVFATSNFYAQEASTEKVEALDEVVVIATKFPVKKENVGKTVVTITKETIEKMPFQSVAVLLNQITGIEINGTNSNAGKNLGYYVRGGRSHQLLVLIDGIPVTDPSGINFSYDLNLLALQQVESIEIMKGAASTLYGSGAAAGVINITLKKPSKEGFKGNAMFGLGTNNTSNKNDYAINKYTQSVDVSGSKNKTSYLFSFSNASYDGMSEASTETNEKMESDSFQQLNYMAKVGHAFSNQFSINGLGVIRHIKHDYDFGFTDSDINQYENKEIMIGLSPVYQFSKGELKGNVAFKTINRNDINEYGSSEFKSESMTADVFNKITLGQSWNLITGFDYQQHNTDYTTSYDNLDKETANFYMVDPYVTAVYQGKTGFNLNLGGRLNIHEKYGNYTVYNINPSYFISTPKVNINLMGSVSTAYITPSLYQLYSFYGNLDLNPEESTTYELGYDIQLSDKKLTFNQTYFYREETDKIGFYTDFTTWESYYYNQDGKQFFSGIENDLTYKFTDNFNVKINHIYTNLDKQNSFLIPKVKWNAFVDYYINSKTSISAQYQYNGKRTAQDFRDYPATIVNLEAYQLLNLGFKTAIIKDRLNFFIDINNLLNEKFIENLGYSTKGRNLFAGIHLKF
ncbi:MAG: TonB-dependent receptor plug domain-containing protein [Flavobacteriaceae bacterium]|nr:TonB-dependent receptor plug domain-containing protein [Flavobacteriaceae bacterium]